MQLTPKHVNARMRPPHRRVTTLALAAVIALTLGPATAGAQAPLDLSIVPNEGAAGTVVNGQVDPADVAASCVTDLAEFQARFPALLEGPFAGGGTSGELFERFFPQPDFIFTNHDQAAYSITGIIALGIGLDINGAAETALPQTFAFTFADIATQEPIGDLSTFDPVTGAGTVVAPDVAPGPYAVAAACIGPTLDLDALEAGIRANGAFLQSIGAPFDINSPEFTQFVIDFLGDPNADLFLFLEAIGPDIIQNIAQFDALGLQLFTILPDPSDRIAGVSQDLDALVAAGDLAANKARALTVHLRNAQQSLAQDDVDAACDQLAAFGKVATARVTSGALDAATANALIADVDSIRVQLGCIPPPNGSPSGAFLD